MNKLKKEKGITLVALIITIVVLLILAAVAIGAVQESKIIGHAQNAAGSFNQAKENEIDILEKYETELDKYAGVEQATIVYNNSHQSYFEVVESDGSEYDAIGYCYRLKNEYRYSYVEETEEWVAGSKISEVPSKLIIPKEIEGISAKDIVLIIINNPNVSHLCIPDTQAKIYIPFAKGDLRISSETGNIVDVDFEPVSEEYKEALKSIVFDDNIKKVIGFYYSNRGLEKIKYPSNLIEIEDNYFSSTRSLRSIILPNLLTTIIANYAHSAIFGSGHALLHDEFVLTYMGTKEEWNTMLSNNGKNKVFKDRDITVRCTDGDIVV